MLLGFGAFALTLFLQLPASLLLGRLPSPLPFPWTVVAPGLMATGTVWDGQLSGLGLLGRPLGEVRWELSPWRLLVGRWLGITQFHGDGASLETAFEGQSDGSITLRRLSSTWPLANLQPTGKSAWRGQLVARLATVRLSRGQLVDWSGQVELRQLAVPGSGAILGDFRMEKPAGAGQAFIQDLGGPVYLRGALLRQPDGRWALVGEAAPRAEASAAVREALLMFGPPDIRGQHGIRLEFGVSPPP